MAIDPARTVVIANPAAAGGEVGRWRGMLREKITDALGPLRFELTERPGHASELAERAVNDGVTSVLSLGGDGTHHEVVQGLARSGSREVALGVLPVGTGGDLRRSLAEQSFEGMLELLPVVPSRAIDLGHATYLTDDGRTEERWFINLASCGLGGLVDRHVNASGKRLGALSFLAAGAVALASYKPPRVRVSIDGEDLGEHAVSIVAACNGRYAGGGMCFAPDASLDDGLLDMLVVDHAPAWRAAWDLPRLYTGTLAALPRVVARRGRELRVESVEGTALIDLDGESPGRAPVTFRVAPGALRLLG